MKLKIEMLQDFGSIGQTYGLVSENGEILYTHFCSDKAYAFDDLYGKRPERQEELAKRFGTVEVESYRQVTGKLRSKCTKRRC